jgi:hypothetical protein
MKNKQKEWHPATKPLLTRKKYKFQSRSQKNSHSCVPLNFTKIDFFCFRSPSHLPGCKKSATNISLLSTFKRMFIMLLKEQSHKIFCFRFFHELSSPKPLKITLGSLRIFEIFASQGAQPVLTTPSANLQIMGTISDCLHLKVNLKEQIYLCVNSAK